MAIRLTQKTVTGLTAHDAYHRVENLSLANKKQMNFAVRSYFGIENPSFAEKYHSCAYDIDGENPFKQAYEHIKGLSEFAGAQDC